MERVEIPSYFLCPISLQIMKDPVALSTGITYDRESIEQWLFSGDFDRKINNTVCPVTNQQLENFELTPNHTLRRLIQAWCTVNSTERFPTPRAPVEQSQISTLIDVGRQPCYAIESLRKLHDIVFQNERNKRCVERTPGVLQFLASVIEHFSSCESLESERACDDALFILNNLKFTEDEQAELVLTNAKFLESLTRILNQHSCQQLRSYAVSFLASVFYVVVPSTLANVSRELIKGTVNVISDRISNRTTKAALRVLSLLCPWGQNRIKAVEFNSVHVLVEVLIEQTERRTCEMALVVLDLLCGCDEGIEALVEHAAGVAVVSKKVMRVSKLASEKAVNVVSSVAKNCASKAIVQDMLELGVVSKLCLVLQVEDCVSVKTKEKAREILRLNCSEWRNSPCLTPLFKASYPCAK